ncbi:MAG: prolyl oligopeptidase family serine peptidase [bacterium]
MNNSLTTKYIFHILLLSFALILSGCGGLGDIHNPPLIIIDSPAGLTGLTGLVRISGRVQVQSGFSISTPTYHVDEQPVHSVSGKANWFFDLDTTHFTPGQHILQISVVDSGAQTSTLKIEFSVIPVAGGNQNIITGLNLTTLENTFDISSLLYGLKGWRITYFSSNENGNPVSVGGWAMKPDGSGPFPTLIWCRGGVSGNASENFIWSLANRGYAVFASDYQGEGDFASGKPDIFGTEVYDNIALLNIAKTMPFVDKNKIFMWGGSRGSAVTLLTLDRLAVVGRENEIRAAACTNTIYDIATALDDGINAAELEVIEYYKSLKGVSTQAAIDQLNSRSAGVSINHDDITTPIFIGHAGQNQNYPPFHSEALFNDMTNQGVVVEYQLYPDVENDLETDPEADVFSDILDFWLAL